MKLVSIPFKVHFQIFYNINKNLSAIILNKIISRRDKKKFSFFMVLYIHVCPGVFIALVLRVNMNTCTCMSMSTIRVFSSLSLLSPQLTNHLQLSYLIAGKYNVEIHQIEDVNY